MSNLFQIERFILPSSQALPIENVCHFTITVMIQQTIDLGHNFRFGPNLSNRLWFAKTRSAFKRLKLAELDEESISHRNPLNNSLFGLTTAVQNGQVQG